MELKYKHIAPYLPFKLQMMMESCVASREPNIDVLSGIQYDGLLLLGTGGRFGFTQREFKDVKPILHSMGDIDIKMDELRELFHDTTESKDGSATFTRTLIFDDGFKIKVEDYYYTSDNVNIYYEDINDFEIYQKLFEWHFDVFNLIEKGLAIDKKTL